MMANKTKSAFGRFLQTNRPTANAGHVDGRMRLLQRAMEMSDAKVRMKMLGVMRNRLTLAVHAPGAEAAGQPVSVMAKVIASHST